MIRSFIFPTLAVTLLAFSPTAENWIFLDDVMTREEQCKIGLNNLTMRQKIALENWLNKYFVLKNPPVKPLENLTMSLNIENGKKLQLSDDSLWEIDPDDVPKAAVWITAFPVKIRPSNDPDYPYLIINNNTKARVKARRAVPMATLPETTPGTQEIAPGTQESTPGTQETTPEMTPQATPATPETTPPTQETPPGIQEPTPELAPETAPQEETPPPPEATPGNQRTTPGIAPESVPALPITPSPSGSTP